MTQYPPLIETPEEARELHGYAPIAQTGARFEIKIINLGNGNNTLLVNESLVYRRIYGYLFGQRNNASLPGHINAQIGLYFHETIVAAIPVRWYEGATAATTELEAFTCYPILQNYSGAVPSYAQPTSVNPGDITLFLPSDVLFTGELRSPVLNPIPMQIACDKVILSIDPPINILPANNIFTYRFACIVISSATPF